MIKLLLILLSSLSITELCTCGDLLSDSSSRVASLPGFHEQLPFKLHSGYISVNEESGNRLFYYFVESERNPEEDPLLLWLMGGPGTSGLFSLMYQLGPLLFEDAEFPLLFEDAEFLQSGKDVPDLVLNPYSWTKVSSIIFLDIPTGAGFSYSQAYEDYQSTTTKMIKDAHKFLIKWYAEFPNFLSNPLYIGGESHSGIVVPQLVQELVHDIEQMKEPIPNLKGYLLGNALTIQDFDTSHRISFAYGMGLISYELYQEIKETCGGQYDRPLSALCLKSMKGVEECVSGLNHFHILEPKCETSYVYGEGERADVEVLKLQKQYIIKPPKCRDETYKYIFFWANNVAVREALHATEAVDVLWTRTNHKSKKFNYTMDIYDSIESHLFLTKRGYRALIYSGDHDYTAPFSATEAWIRYLNSSIVDEWRPWMVDDQVAGYTRQYDNDLTFATVKGAGHSATQYKPKETQEMFERWISHRPL